MRAGAAWRPHYHAAWLHSVAGMTWHRRSLEPCTSVSASQAWGTVGPAEFSSRLSTAFLLAFQGAAGRVKGRRRAKAELGWGGGHAGGRVRLA